MPKKNDPITTLGREIRAARERLRYSQDALGDLLSVSGTIISRWETGRYTPPIESLAKLADIAGGTELERDELYTRWVGLAGYREPRSGGREEAPESGLGAYLTTTLEGAMGRAVIDQIPDPDKRLDLVLRLRQWAQQLQEGGEENELAHDHEPSRPEGRELACAAASAETPT